MESPPARTINVWNAGGVTVAHRAARTRAREIGFGETAVEEIALVARELASNLVKHAGGGTIRLLEDVDSGDPGIVIESLDSGPGIADVDHALTDGVTSAGSLGYGLGTVHRLMDEVQVTPRAGLEGGTRILCTRWHRSTPSRVDMCPLEIGVLTRAHPRMDVNGDAFVIKRWGQRALVAVIDGLGHGQFALRAARTAREYIERHYDQSLESLFLGTNRVCRSTRGVVMAAARFDCAESKMSFASVGNIEARFIGTDHGSLLVRRGVVGLNAPKPNVSHHFWGAGAGLVLHSDGLSTRWGRGDFPGLEGMSADEAAKLLFQRLDKSDDDATIAVVKAQ